MTNPGSKSKRVLVVDDEQAISDLCRRVLISEGFEVDIAADGKIAQNMLEEQQYDLCLIDIKLPTMNGKDLYQWLQEKQPQLARSVMFITGDVMGGDTFTFLEKTTRPFLLKPFTPAQLEATVRETLMHIDK